MKHNKSVLRLFTAKTVCLFITFELWEIQRIKPFKIEKEHQEKERKEEVVDIG